MSAWKAVDVCTERQGAADMVRFVYNLEDGSTTKFEFEVDRQATVRSYVDNSCHKAGKLRTWLS